MMMTNARAAYMDASVTTADPAQPAGHALRPAGARRGSRPPAQRTGDYPEAHNQLLHAQAIVIELRTSLRPGAVRRAARARRHLRPPAPASWCWPTCARTRRPPSTASTSPARIAETWREAAIAARGRRHERHRDRATTSPRLGGPAGPAGPRDPPGRAPDQGDGTAGRAAVARARADRPRCPSDLLPRALEIQQRQEAARRAAGARPASHRAQRSLAERLAASASRRHRATSTSAPEEPAARPGQMTQSSRLSSSPGAGCRTDESSTDCSTTADGPAPIVILRKAAAVSLVVSDAVEQVLCLALDGVSLRQRVTADNIANVDTPGFRATSVDFETSLRQAVEGGTPGATPRRGSVPRPRPPTPPSAPTATTSTCARRPWPRSSRSTSTRSSRVR